MSATLKFVIVAVIFSLFILGIVVLLALCVAAKMSDEEMQRLMEQEQEKDDC